MRRNIAKVAVFAARVIATGTKAAVIAGVAVPHTATIAYAKYDLPAPYVSRALGAVLIPINHASRHRYQIPPNLRGVYVLAVSPHGVAAKQGIRPGDVLATVRSQPILVPADVDRLVWGALAVSVTDFLFGVARGPDVIQVNTNISVVNFNQSININNINNWTSVENQSEWTQIVNQYNTNISTSINENNYQSGTVTNNSGVPEPGQNFDGTNRSGASGTDVPEPGQNFDGSRRDDTSTDRVPEPGQNFDGTNRSGASENSVPEPGQDFDGSRRDGATIPEPAQSSTSGNDTTDEDTTDGSTDSDTSGDDTTEDGADGDTSSDDTTDDGANDDTSGDNTADDSANDDASSDDTTDDSANDDTSSDDTTDDSGNDDTSSDGDDEEK